MNSLHRILVDGSWSGRTLQPVSYTHLDVYKRQVLLVRPRGLHLEEKHIEINGEKASGSLIDFGIYFFRNAKKLLENGSGPYFYLPKLEHYKEARWWNDVFVFAQN